MPGQNDDFRQDPTPSSSDYNDEITGQKGGQSDSSGDLNKEDTNKNKNWNDEE